MATVVVNGDGVGVAQAAGELGFAAEAFDDLGAGEKFGR